MKKTILYLTASFLLLCILPGCHKHKKNNTTTPLSGSWTESTDFEGVARSNSVALTIGSKAYIGTGFTGTTRLNDFWEFDIATTSWQQVADVPGVPREKAAGFALTTKGYLGTGYDGANLLKDFYEYDPVGNSWTSIADFGYPDPLVTGRSSAVGFAFDSVGFVGAGFDGNYKNDVYKYRPITDEWIKVASLPKKTSEAVVFVIDTMAYVCSGINNGLPVSEVSEFHPKSNTWVAKTSLTTGHDIRRTGASAFTLNGLGYMTCGNNGATVTGSTWSYSPSSDTWTQVTDLSGSVRTNAVAFTVGNRAFVATGKNNNLRFDDLWEFHP